MTYHPKPYDEISKACADPAELIDDLYQQLLEVRPYFPGDTNITGHCIDAVLDRLEALGARRNFEIE